MQKISKKKYYLSKFGNKIRPDIDFLALLEANKDRIECYQNINLNAGQPYDTKVRTNISVRCPQRLFPPIQIDSELYAVGSGEKQQDENSLKLNYCHIWEYKLHVRRGARTFCFEINTERAQQIYQKMWELYNNKRYLQKKR